MKSGRSLVLGSTSPYRKELLQRLGIPFRTAAPEVDESPRGDETPTELAARLALAKAKAVAATCDADALVIGSDQVAVLDGHILGKPGTRANAIAQLSAASGKTVTFQTGLCVLDVHSGRQQLEVVPFAVTFRTLTEMQIQHYVDREQPYNCAGSFKSEGLGVALFERMHGEDPTALIGLPLIRLVHMLEEAGLEVL